MYWDRKPMSRVEIKRLLPNVSDAFSKFLETYPWYTSMFVNDTVQVDDSTDVISKTGGPKAFVRKLDDFKFMVELDKTLRNDQEEYDVVIEHELFHVMLDHFERIPHQIMCGIKKPARCQKCSKKRQEKCEFIKMLWQFGSDLSINCMIFDSALAQRVQVLMPEQFMFPDFLSMDVYMNLLKKSKKFQEDFKNKQKMDEMMQNMFEDISKIAQDMMSGKGKEGKGKNKGKADGKDGKKGKDKEGDGKGKRNEDSGQDGQGSGDEDSDMDPQKYLKKMVFDGAIKQVCEDYQDMDGPQRLQNSGRSWGDQAGTGQVMAELGAKVGYDIDWKSKMNKGILRGGKLDIRYKKYKTDKRYGTCPGTYLSHLIKPLICIDTSGSIKQGQLGLFRDQINKNVQLFEGAWVAEGDTMVHDQYPLGRGISPDHKFKGRGGTSFLPFFELAEMGKWDVVIIFTDGEGDYPDFVPSKYKVIWALQNGTAHVPWGERVYITAQDRHADDRW